MRNILDIYKEYKIMPVLAMHQLRVTAVAMQICESLDIEVDIQDVITACLLHDMGNIIKSDLKYFPQYNEPEGFEYWQKVQNEYFEKYGKDETKATLAIIEELKLSKRVSDIVDMFGYHNLYKINDTTDFSKKITNYADFRVSPHGVVSVADRLEEGKIRYAKRLADLHEKDSAEKEKALYEIEKQIFSHTKIKPEDITEESVQPYIEKLKSFEI